MAALYAGCAPLRVANPGPSATALPDPCSLISIRTARQLIPGVVFNGSASSDPRTASQCNWFTDDADAITVRNILVSLQLYRDSAQSTGSYQAHQYLLAGRQASSTPVRGLGNEAFTRYFAPVGQHRGGAEVVFGWGNEVAVIQYAGSDFVGTTRRPIGQRTATATALALARGVFRHLSGSSRPASP
jgi:hypothetical protein